MTTLAGLGSTCDATVLAGIFGIVGIIAGATLSWIGGYFVARHAAGAATAEAKRKEALEIKAAAQLVGSSFMDGASLIDTILLRKNWVSSVVVLSLEPWQTYAHILTYALSEDDFLPVYQAANNLRGLMDVQSKAEKAGRTAIDEREAFFMAAMKDKMAHGFSILVTLSQRLKTAIPKNSTEAPGG
jgi:hypothetical protein